MGGGGNGGSTVEANRGEGGGDSGGPWVVGGKAFVVI